MPLGTEVGLDLRDNVFDVGPATPRKKGTPTPSNFGPCLLWPNGWIDEDAAWYGSRPRPRPHCTRRGPSSRERGTAVPLFSAHGYCGHGRPSQLLLSSCFYFLSFRAAAKLANSQVFGVRTTYCIVSFLLDISTV